MKRWLALALLLVVGGAAAAEVATLERCQDAEGHPLEVRQDESAPRPADIRYEGDRPVLVVNGAALPGLTTDAQGFLFARACAQAVQGSAAATDAASAAAMDCAAISAMVRSGLLDSEARVIDIEASLSSADPGWTVLPAPPRHWALRRCFRKAVVGEREPPLTDQRVWDSCVHRCGEGLRSCQKDRFSTSGACMDAYERCSSVCDFRAE